MNGLVSMGDPTIHLARDFRESWCGGGFGGRGNSFPVGAVNADDPHLCSDCASVAAAHQPTGDGAA